MLVKDADRVWRRIQALGIVSDNERGARLKFPTAPANKPQATMKDNNASLGTFQKF